MSSYKLIAILIAANLGISSIRANPFPNSNAKYSKEIAEILLRAENDNYSREELIVICDDLVSSASIPIVDGSPIQKADLSVEILSASHLTPSLEKILSRRTTSAIVSCISHGKLHRYHISHYSVTDYAIAREDALRLLKSTSSLFKLKSQGIRRTDYSYLNHL